MIRAAKTSPVFTVLLCLSLIQPVVAEENSDFNWYLTRARQDMKIKSYSAAIEALEKGLLISPTHKESLRTLGMAYEYQGLIDKAVTQYETYLRYYPNDADISFRLANILMWDDYKYRRHDSLKYFELGFSQKRNPKARKKYNQLLFELEGRNDYRREAFKRSLKEEPDNRNLVLALGTIYEEDGWFKKAIYLYRSYLNKVPLDRDIAGRLSRILSWQQFEKHKKRAIASYKWKAKQQGRESPYYILLGWLDTSQPPPAKVSVADLKKAVEKNPNNQLAWLELGRYYESQGEFENAVDLYSTYLQRFPKDTEVCFKQAEMLSWDRFEDRRDESVALYKTCLAIKDNSQARLKYAQLISAEEKTRDEAIQQYKHVLKSDPENLTALTQLAHMYSWAGDSDSAVFYGEKAKELTPEEADTDLPPTLLEGRGQALWIWLRGFLQNGKPFDLDGYTGSVVGRTNVNAFSTVWLEAGGSHYENSRDDEQDLFVTGRAQYRIKSKHHIEGMAGYHSVGPADRGLEFDTSYAYHPDSYLLKLGFKRDFREDSLLAVAGEDFMGGSFGAARQNVVYGEVSAGFSFGHVWIRPFAGWVSAQALSNNNLSGVDWNWVSRPFVVDDPNRGFRLGYKSQNVQYQKDYSGFPRTRTTIPAGGIFSPKFFTNHTPYFRYDHQINPRSRWTVEAGPSIQYLKEFSRSAEWNFGGEGSLIYFYQVTDRIGLKLGASYQQIETFYDRIGFEAHLRL